MSSPIKIGAFPLGVFNTLAAAMFWGSMAVAVQFVMATGAVDAASLVVVRLGVSGAVLFCWCLAVMRKEVLRIFQSAENLRDVLFAAFFIYGGQFAFMLAIYYSNAGAAAIMLTTVPLWIALWESAVNRKPPSGRTLICLVIAAAGVCLIVTKGRFDAVEFNLKGLLWALACAMMTAGYSVQPRKLLKRVNMLAVMGCAMLAGGLMAAVVAFVGGASLALTRLDVRTAGLLFYVVVFGTLIAFCCYMTAIRMISPVIVSILGCAEPVTAYVLTAVVFDLSVGTFECIGIVMVLFTVVLLSIAPSGTTQPGEDISHHWRKKEQKKDAAP